MTASDDLEKINAFLSYIGLRKLENGGLLINKQQQVSTMDIIYISTAACEDTARHLDERSPVASDFSGWHFRICILWYSLLRWRYSFVYLDHLSYDTDYGRSADT